MQHLLLLKHLRCDQILRSDFPDCSPCPRDKHRQERDQNAHECVFMRTETRKGERERERGRGEVGDGTDGRKAGGDPPPEFGLFCLVPTPPATGGGTHQLVIGGVGVVVGVRLGDAHGHAVGEYGEENENIKGLEDSVKGSNGRGARQSPVGGGQAQEERIFPLHQGQRRHADGVAEGEAAEGSGGSEGRLVGLHRLLGPPSSFPGRAS